MAGVEMTRDLPLRSPIQTRYGQLYSVKDVLVTTNISGYASGFKKQAMLVVEPKQLQIDVDSYIQIGEKDGYRIFLKPGKWALKLHCSIQAIENPEGRSWYAKRASESVVKGEKFGREHKPPSADDPYSGLLYINPYGTVLYGISQVKGLFGFVFHRPNITLPATTELHFRIEQVEATYLSRPVPKGPARIVQ